MENIMKDNHERKQASINELNRALFEAIGQNDPYPTPEEIFAHKRYAKYAFPHMKIID